MILTDGDDGVAEWLGLVPRICTHHETIVVIEEAATVEKGEGEAEDLLEALLQFEYCRAFFIRAGVSTGRDDDTNS